MRKFLDHYHLNPALWKNLGGWCGAAMWVAATALRSQGTIPVDPAILSALEGLGGGMAGAVLLHSVDAWSHKAFAGGGGMLAIMVAQSIEAHAPHSPTMQIIAALMRGLAGMSTAGVVLHSPNPARASLAPPAPVSGR